MRKLPKMTIEECSIPVSQVCCIPSQLEAEAIAATSRIKYKCIKPAHLVTSLDEHQICWCAMQNKQEISKTFPMFKENTPIKGLPLIADFIEEGHYINYDNHFYVACQDDTYKLLIKEMNIFSTYEDIFAVYQLSAHQFISFEEAEELPEIYLARITPVDDPNNQLCVCWFIDKENFPPFFPIFAEDMQVFYQNDCRTLNWEFLGEDDIFTSHGQRYQVCFDDKEHPYIAKLSTCNMTILPKA